MNLAHWHGASPTLAPVSTAALFNGFTGSHVAMALQELGTWDRLKDGKRPVALLAEEAGCDVIKMSALLRTMGLLGYVRFDAGEVSLTEAGHELVRDIGFFVWGVGGYGPVLNNLVELAAGTKRFGEEVRRDERHIAIGAGQVDRSVMRSIEQEVLAGIEYSSVADLGCGDATRLIRLCGETGERRGLGIDISESATDLASARVAAAGLSDRVDIVCEDVLKSMTGETFPGIELVANFLMMHDLLASTDDGGEVIRSLRRVFPDARYFLVADTTAQPWPQHDGPVPIFSLEFELVHTFMDTPIMRREVYEAAFAAGGLRVLRCEPFGAPSTWLFLLEASDEPAVSAGAPDAA
ncbi:SAM-dependent methyltransferase [Streptomyces sp. NPDC055607]